MRPWDSVRAQVTWLLLAMVLLVSVVAAAGAAGVASMAGHVDVLVDDLRPAAHSNIALRNDMARAQAGVRGVALTGDDRFHDRYRIAVEEARIERRRLAELLLDDGLLDGPVAEQERAMEVWISFAERLLRRDPNRVPRPLLLGGDNAFERFVAANDAVSFGVNAAVDARGEQARDRARGVTMFVAFVSLLGLAATAMLGLSIVRRVSGPLRDMETAVARLADGERDARTRADGPREIRAVAAALNTLAEENQRAREMEEQVVSRLQRLDRAKDEFVSTVSHELRTPLTSISGYLELIEDEFAGGIGPEQRGMLGVVKRNVARLRSLIEDLLTLSSVESDAFRTSFELVDMTPLTSDVVRDVAEIAARARVRVRESSPGGSVPVRGDAGQLSRALLNLVTNAIKFSRPESQVLVRLAELDGTAVVSVVDHGIGIPAAEVATLGSRFFRASNAVEAEITGTGLGLRIVQTIADNHGGRLEVESTEGEGTTARLVVPLAGDERHGNIPAVPAITEG
jgi:two-component system OmpR family sensor kinase